MPLVIRLNDTSSHGGNVITAASKTYAEQRLIARIGDTLNCAIHGPNPIVEGSPDTYVEGARVARQGDHAACGAALISDAVKTFISGSGVSGPSVDGSDITIMDILAILDLSILRTKAGTYFE